MTGLSRARAALAFGCAVMLAATGCAFEGVNSLPLPGTVGTGTDAAIYHVEIANVGTLESNSPVLISDVVVGAVGRMKLNHWNADVDLSLRPDVVVPANAVATVGQTSLLGSMHVSLDPPPGEPPTGRLAPGATLGLDQTSSYPSTEQTLSSLSTVINTGGVGQIGDIVHNFNSALNGREGQIRDLLTRADRFIGTFADQRDQLIATAENLNRFAGTLAGRRDVIAEALTKIPPALEVLIRERPRITTALEKLRIFSDTATGLVNDVQGDLIKNLQNLEPTIRALADIGPDLDLALAYAPTFPLNQNLIDRALRGDYFNVFAIADLTVPRLKRTVFLGTRFGQEGAPLVAAPGEPYYGYYTYDPLHVGIAPPPAGAGMPPDGQSPSEGSVPGAPPPPEALSPPSDGPAELPGVPAALGGN